MLLWEIKKQLEIWHGPEEVVVSPENSVTMLQLNWTGDWSTVYICSEEVKTKDWNTMWFPYRMLKKPLSECLWAKTTSPCAAPSEDATLAVLCDDIPRIAVRREHHAVVLCDVDDAMLGLDGHPTQLDVLRVGWAHTGVLLDRGSSTQRRDAQKTHH